MCPCDMQRRISICAIVDASGKADTMVGLFFVPRGSGQIRSHFGRNSGFVHFKGPINGGLMFRASAQNVYYGWYIQ